METNSQLIKAKHFQEAVANVDIQIIENIDALCYEWLEKAINEVEAKAEREIGLKLLAIIRGITQ